MKKENFEYTISDINTLRNGIRERGIALEEEVEALHRYLEFLDKILHPED